MSVFAAKNLLASSLEQKGERCIFKYRDKVILGLATGSSRSHNPKHWINEDSIMSQQLGEHEFIALVADSHWGGLASEIVAGEAARIFALFSKAETIEKRLRVVLFELDRRLESAKEDPKQDFDRSATTVLLVHIDKHILTFANMGDSLLFIIRKQELMKVETLVGFYPIQFLGDMSMDSIADDYQPDSGVVALEPDDIVILATDGIEQASSGLTLKQIPSFFKATSDNLEDDVRALFERADDVEKGGGHDNLGIVAIRIE